MSRKRVIQVKRKDGKWTAVDAFKKLRERKVESTSDGRLYRDPVNTLARPAVRLHLRRLKEIEAGQS